MALKNRRMGRGLLLSECVAAFPRLSVRTRACKRAREEEEENGWAERESRVRQCVCK